MATEAESTSAGNIQHHEQQQQQQQRVSIAVRPQLPASCVGGGGGGDDDEDDVSTVHPVAVVSANPTVGVPVTLPVGSIIANGTTFNVITSEQLQMANNAQFKPMICVDNSFLCETRPNDKNNSWSNDLKATHIVIQNNADDGINESIQISTGGNAKSCSWTESAKMPVLPVRCKNTNAELHKSRFGSGGRGKCIKFGNEWYTPSEFEALCGRASSKDWKRSIRFGGRSLQTLIEEQILRPHATSCTCAACCDDDNAAGPIRLFTPYKRKRKMRDDFEDDSTTHKHKDGSRDYSEESDADEKPTYNVHSYAQSQNSQELELNSKTQSLQNGHKESKYQKLEEIANKMTKIANEFKKIVEEYKAEEKKLEETAQQTANNKFGLEPASNSNKKLCVNCNRDAYAECSLCRRTPYCSAFCQRKDWNQHQIECTRESTETVMLIVDNSADNNCISAQTTDSKLLVLTPESDTN
ncbi:unnamed protein product [Trichogramma brassicae]|uniref:MYND-type domain-containing protein n=1 Tax=Trichogramma brassicae TaxID=86971 RepID=A0A6H5IMF8_9HYME|nr:unnamed protein product [Trichogramma brassicae]